MVRCPQPDALSFSLLKRTVGDGKMEKIVCRGKDKDITHQLLYGQNGLSLEKINLIHCQLKEVWMVRNNNKQNIFLLPTLLLARLTLTPSFPTPTPPLSWGVQGDGEYGLRSVHKSYSLLLLAPHTVLLLQYGSSLLTGGECLPRAPTSFFSDLTVYRAVSHSCFYYSARAARQHFFLFVKYTQKWHHLGQVPQPCSVVCVLELAGIGCAQDGSAPATLHSGYPAAPSLPAPHHGHSVQEYAMQ